MKFLPPICTIMLSLAANHSAATPYFHYERTIESAEDVQQQSTSNNLPVYVLHQYFETDGIMADCEQFSRDIETKAFGALLFPIDGSLLIRCHPLGTSTIRSEMDFVFQAPDSETSARLAEHVEANFPAQWFGKTVVVEHVARFLLTPELSVTMDGQVQEIPTEIETLTDFRGVRHRINTTSGATTTTSTSYTPGSDLSLGKHTLYVQEQSGSGSWSTSSSYDYWVISLPTPYMKLDANDIDGDGVENSGSISSTGISTFYDSSPTSNIDATMFGFTSNTTTSGWNGAGSTSDPYRLVLDGVDDRFRAPAHATAAFSFWFKPEGSTISDVNYDYLFHSSSSNYRAYMNSGILMVVYAGITHQVSIDPANWNHLVVTNDGSNSSSATKIYLNGIEVASGGGSVMSSSMTYYFSNDAGGAIFKGQLGILTTYSTGLTASNVRDVYQYYRNRYVTAPTSVNLTRITPAVANTSGGATITLIGHHFSNVTDVKFGTTSASNITTTSNGILTVTVPSSASAGYVDVSVTSNGTTVTKSSAFYYTGVTTTGLLNWLDAKNLETLGTHAIGTAQTRRNWIDMGPSGHNLSMYGFSMSTSSGWAGDSPATTTNPNRLVYDSNPNIATTTPKAFKAISIHFKTGSSITGQLYTIDTNTRGYFSSNQLVWCYNGQCSTYTTNLSPNTHYHVVITNNGNATTGTTTGYIHSNQSSISAGSLTTMGTTTSAALSNNTNWVGLHIGSNDNSMSINGSVLAYSVYSSDLSTNDVAALFNEFRSRYP